MSKAPPKPTLPPAINEYPPYIAILGEPISKCEYAIRRSTLVPFITMHMSKIREVLDSITRLNVNDIDIRQAIVNSPLLGMDKRARAAWEVLAWHTMVKPFEHPGRTYHFDSSKCEAIVDKDADALYMYALFLVRKPDINVYRKLKTMHPDTARQYFNYARNFAVAQHEFEPIGWLTNW